LKFIVWDLVFWKFLIKKLSFDNLKNGFRKRLASHAGKIAVIGEIGLTRDSERYLE
jgi:hypothetical protein